MSETYGGYTITGMFKGVVKKPWSNDETKFNYLVGVVTHTYEGQFGDIEENLEAIELPYREEESWMATFNNTCKPGDIITFGIRAAVVVPRQNPSNAFVKISVDKKQDVKVLVKAADLEKRKAS